MSDVRYTMVNGNLCFITDNNVDNELVTLLGKPFTTNEYYLGNVTEDRKNKIPHSYTEEPRSIEWYSYSFQVTKDCKLKSKWITELIINGCVVDESTKVIIDWITQLFDRYGLFTNNEEDNKIKIIIEDSVDSGCIYITDERLDDDNYIIKRYDIYNEDWDSAVKYIYESNEWKRSLNETHI